MADKLLEVKGVSKIFRVGGMLRGKKLVAVDNVSLSIDDDKPVILSIVGESGCGKSTLCKMILRLHNPDMGDIVLDGKSYADKKSYDPKQFKLDVQPIFQNPYESFSARKTVDTYLYNTALRLGIAKNKAEADKVVDEALKSVGMSLAVVKGKYATQFSGGELQRVSIARALMGSVFDINMDFSKPIENLEGEAPSPLELPEGCPFQGRCTKCMAICKKEAPQMVSLTPDHQVACHLYTKNMQK